MSRRNWTLILVALQKFHSSWLELRPSRLMPKPRSSSSSAPDVALAEEVALAAVVVAMPVVLAVRLAVVDPRMLMTTKRRVVFPEDEALIPRKRRLARSVALRLITDSSLALAESVSDSAPASDMLAWIPVSGRPHRSRLMLSSWDLTDSKSIELVTLAPAWSELWSQATRELVVLRFPVTSRVTLADDAGEGEAEAGEADVAGEEDVADGDLAGEDDGLGEAKEQLRPEPMSELKITASPFTATVPPIRVLVRLSVGLDEGAGLAEVAGLPEAAGLAEDAGLPEAAGLVEGEGEVEALAGSPSRKISKGCVALSSKVWHVGEVEAEGEDAGEAVWAIAEPRRAAKIRIVKWFMSVVLTWRMREWHLLAPLIAATLSRVWARRAPPGESSASIGLPSTRDWLNQLQRSLKRRRLVGRPSPSTSCRVPDPSTTPRTAPKSSRPSDDSGSVPLLIGPYSSGRRQPEISMLSTFDRSEPKRRRQSHREDLIQDEAQDSLPACRFERCACMFFVVATFVIHFALFIAPPPAGQPRHQALYLHYCHIQRQAQRLAQVQLLLIAIHNKLCEIII